jgi:hypothetical protein
LLALPIKGRQFAVNGGCYSKDGGTGSLFHYRRDALQLAAHELGARPARDSPPGVHVATAAGKEYLSKIRPFQKSKLTESEDVAQAIKILQQDIEFRMVEIYEQLLNWPQAPIAPLQGDRWVSCTAPGCKFIGLCMINCRLEAAKPVIGVMLEDADGGQSPAGRHAWAAQLF